jgi:hypothetical protein
MDQQTIQLIISGVLSIATLVFKWLGDRDHAINQAQLVQIEDRLKVLEQKK